LNPSFCFGKLLDAVKNQIQQPKQAWGRWCKAPYLDRLTDKAKLAQSVERQMVD
jgi:hypothetical protein